MKKDERRASPDALCAPPFRCSCRGSRASSSRLIVLSVAPGPIRIFITHFSPRHTFLEERLLVSHHTRCSHPPLFLVLDSFRTPRSLRGPLLLLSLLLLLLFADDSLYIRRRSPA